MCMYGAASRMTSVGVTGLIQAARGERGSVCVCPGVLSLRSQLSMTLRDVCLQGHFGCCIILKSTQKDLECGHAGNFSFKLRSLDDQG